MKVEVFESLASQPLFSLLFTCTCFFSSPVRVDACVKSCRTLPLRQILDFIVLGGLHAVYHGFRVYQRVTEPCLYPLSDEVHNGELGCAFCHFVLLRRSMGRLEIVEAVRCSSYLVGHTYAVLNRVKCIVCYSCRHT